MKKTRISPALFISFIQVMYCMYVTASQTWGRPWSTCRCPWWCLGLCARCCSGSAPSCCTEGADQLIQNGRHQGIGRTERRKEKFLHCLHTSTFPKKYLFRHLKGQCRKIFTLLRFPFVPNYRVSAFFPEYSQESQFTNISRLFFLLIVFLMRQCHEMYICWGSKHSKGLKLFSL